MDNKEGKSIGTSKAAQTWEQNGRSEVLLELSDSEVTKKVAQLLFTETPPQSCYYHNNTT